MQAQLEHANFTVSDPQATAAWLCEIFGWHIRWQGPAMQTGHTVHVGTDSGYLALFSPGTPDAGAQSSYQTVGGLNHVAVTVPDLTEAEARVKRAGFSPKNHADYEPGKRFYFHDHDGIEFEVVSYAA
ncbi:VOC family protein [Thalassovita taeanensis]|uniref:Catechol 2,3-dioxygenase n=1 Tax=Thalassovita taeanensis TaxID=657014 RepID=A0A1H9ATM6_9RHOB|nr:VOC family protein [Thalassovita taeanensis]SEP79278.1 Catechol 2,3-dioxygenase [Thalassovita taeanensis]